MPLFDLPPIAWPDWYKPTKARPASNSRYGRPVTCPACLEALG